MPDEANNDVGRKASRLSNKYRRAFNWRVSRGGGNLASDIAGSVRLATSDYPDVLEDYLYISRKRQHNVLAISKLQLKMLDDLLVQERSIKSLKEKLAGEPEASTNAVNFVKSQVFMHSLIANAIRQVGDGIAWRGFGYDRFTQRILCSHPVKQTVLAEGTVAELNEWSSINDQVGRMAILNVLTNCISIGDVTAIDSENGNVELIEVKSGKTKSRRLIRQRKQLKEAADILNTGEGLVEGKWINSGSLNIVPKNHLAELRALLNQTETNSWSSKLIAPHCYIECLNVKKLGQEDGDLISKVEAARQCSTEKWGNDLIVDQDSLGVISFAPNIAPFSIFPFDDRTCIELAIGTKLFTSYLNVSEVSRQFESSGWRIESMLGDALKRTNGEAILIMEKAGFHCHIPPSDFGRLQFEMLDPATLIESSEILRNSDPKKVGGYGVWTYEGEASLWN